MNFFSLCRRSMTLQLALFFETAFWDIYESFEKYSKQNLEMAESSRSLNPNKKKAKRSKLAGALTTKTTTFKSEWKKEFPLITRVPNDYFFCNIIKCAVFLLIMKFGRYYYGKNLTILFYWFVSIWIYRILWPSQYLSFIVAKVF